MTTPKPEIHTKRTEHMKDFSPHIFIDCVMYCQNTVCIRVVLTRCFIMSMQVESFSMAVDKTRHIRRAIIDTAKEITMKENMSMCYMSKCG